MFLEVLKNLPALLFTLAAGSAVLGALVWAMAAQGAANRRTAYIFWGIAVLLIIWGILR